MTFSPTATPERDTGAMVDAASRPTAPDQDAFVRARILALCGAHRGLHSALATALGLGKNRYFFLLRHVGGSRELPLERVASFFGVTPEVFLSEEALPEINTTRLPSAACARRRLVERLRGLTDEQILALYPTLLPTLEAMAPPTPPAAGDVLAQWRVTEPRGPQSRPLVAAL